MRSNPLPSRLVPLLAALLLSLWGPAARAATSHNYWLAMLEEYGAKRGFNLTLRSSSDTTSLTLANTQLQFGVADGTRWRTHNTAPSGGWQLDRDYVVKAVITPTASELWLNGQRITTETGTYQPSTELEAVRAGYVYQNSGTPNYMVRQTALRLSTSSGKVATATLPALADIHPAVYLFRSHVPVWLPWSSTASETLTIETTFRFIRRPALTEYAPFVDTWGQSIHAQWNGKISSDQQIRDAAVTEANQYQTWGLPTDYDQYGGYTRSPWKETGTGYYRVVRRDAHWWLITPVGTPCFYFGLDSAPGTFEGTRVTGREYLFADVPAKTGDPLSAAWASNMFRFGVANLLRKYGTSTTPSWSERVRDDTVKRMKYWGFSGVGKWSGDIQRAVPRVQVLKRDGVPTLGNGTNASAGHPDIFDPAVRTTFYNKLRAAIVGPSNPDFLIGWSLGNEHDEIILTGEISTILAKAATVPAKKALVDYAIDHIYGGNLASMATAWKVTGSSLTRQSFYNATTAQPPAADIETLRRYFAEEYYKYIYTTVKALDPNHLYMGFWIVINWWENEEDWRIMSRYVDVLGIDRYATNYDDDQVQRLFGESDKPVIIGEFSFQQTYQSTRGFGSSTGAFARDEAHAGELYTKWTEAAARDPYVIGLMWFQYRDQHITGRNDTASTELVLGENHAFGLVDIADRPKWPLVTALRQAHLKAAAQRLEGRAILQAESAVRSGAVVDTAQSGYTGTGYVDFVGNSGDSVEWTINVTTPGTYRLVFRYANGSGTDRPLELRVDNTSLDNLPFAPTATWTTWNTQARTLVLTTGTHKVRLTATGASGGNIDYLQLTKTSAP